MTIGNKVKNKYTSSVPPLQQNNNTVKIISQLVIEFIVRNNMVLFKNIFESSLIV